MTKVGIQRIVITNEVNGAGAWRFRESQKRHNAANELYRRIFAERGTPLLPGYEEIYCTLDEYSAMLDSAIGIDVILTLTNGSELTLQEKFLYTRFKTVTVEYMQNPRTGEEGDWFKMKAQLYFVGYDRKRAMDFQEWILLNWPATKLCQNIDWRLRSNREDGARSNFKYADFDSFPDGCIIARS